MEVVFALSLLLLHIKTLGRIKLMKTLVSIHGMSAIGRIE